MPFKFKGKKMYTICVFANFWSIRSVSLMHATEINYKHVDQFTKVTLTDSRLAGSK